MRLCPGIARDLSASARSDQASRRSLISVVSELRLMGAPAKRPSSRDTPIRTPRNYAPRACCDDGTRNANSPVTRLTATQRVSVSPGRVDQRGYDHPGRLRRLTQGGLRGDAFSEYCPDSPGPEEAWSAETPYRCRRPSSPTSPVCELGVRQLAVEVGGSSFRSPSFCSSDLASITHNCSGHVTD